MFDRKRNNNKSNDNYSRQEFKNQSQMVNDNEPPIPRTIFFITNGKKVDDHLKEIICTRQNTKQNSR